MNNADQDQNWFSLYDEFIATYWSHTAINTSDRSISDAITSVFKYSLG